MALDRALENGLNKKLLNNDELLKEATALEEEIHALKVAYEQYFLGLEKHLPSKEHAELKRKIFKLKGAFVRTTAIKFRINAVQQKFVTYERLWLKTLQEIENGTYTRDLKRLQRKTAAKAIEKKPAVEAQVAPVAGMPAPPLAARAPGPAVPGMPPPPGAAGARPAVAGMPPPPPAAARPPSGPVGASGGNLSDAKVKAIYDAYVQAKKSTNEDTSKLSMDTMAATLRKQVPELLKKHNAKDVDFKVVIKDGKAVLRAVPK